MTGAELKKCRLKKGMTQTELANAAGLTLNAIAKLESGTRKIGYMRAANFIRLADALGMEPKELLGEDSGE